MLASFPPSSSVTRLRVPAALSRTFFPVAVEPVKEILAISGCAVSNGPRSFTSVSTLNPPPGKISFANLANISEVIGVVGAGLSMKLLPSSRAGANLHAASNSGQFQGVIRSEEHTPELQSLMRSSYAVFCSQHLTQTTQHHRPSSQP